jgi:hypothetical protein
MISALLLYAMLNAQPVPQDKPVEQHIEEWCFPGYQPIPNVIPTQEDDTLRA